MNELSSFLTTSEASQLLAVTPSRVRQLILEGTLEATKIGRDLFVHEASVKTFLDHGRRQRGRPKKEQ
jgi:excisionase family DNA binding protein